MDVTKACAYHEIAKATGTSVVDAVDGAGTATHTIAGLSYDKADQSSLIFFTGATATANTPALPDGSEYDTTWSNLKPDGTCTLETHVVIRAAKS